MAEEEGEVAREAEASGGEELVYVSAKRWLLGIEAGLLASWFGAPVALIIANAEWAYQFLFNPKWPMPGWEKAAIVMGDILMALIISLSSSLLVGLFS